MNPAYGRANTFQRSPRPMLKIVLAASVLAITLAVKWPQQTLAPDVSPAPMQMPPDFRQTGNAFALAAPAGVPNSFTVTYTGPESTYLVPGNPVLQMGPSITYSGTASFMGDPSVSDSRYARGECWYWQTTGGIRACPFTIYQSRISGLYWIQCGDKSCSSQGAVGAFREFWYGTITVN